MYISMLVFFFLSFSFSLTMWNNFCDFFFASFIRQQQFLAHLYQSKERAIVVSLVYGTHTGCLGRSFYVMVKALSGNYLIYKQALFNGVPQEQILSLKS